MGMGGFCDSGNRDLNLSRGPHLRLNTHIMHRTRSHNESTGVMEVCLAGASL
jgi:hypothetical protein